MQSLIEKILSAPLPKVDSTPVAQPYYHFQDDEWTPTSTKSAIELEGKEPPTSTFSHLRLITWNIDVLSPGGEPRMAAALSHLHTLLHPPHSTTNDNPTIILLQEMSPQDLHQIRASPWIQQNFQLTDLDASHWPAQPFGPIYGTTTLIDNRLHLARDPFRVAVRSRFSRDGLFVDINTSSPNGGKTLRICNTHLESLVAHPPVRPLQMATLTPFLKDRDIQGSLIAGDMNAIEPFDRTLHSAHGLRDVYLELGGSEDSEEGYTWGQQAPKVLREQFGCSRMDKVLIYGDVKAVSLSRIGEGVQVEDEEARRAILNAGGEVWASDHLGLLVMFEVGGGSSEEVAHGRSLYINH